MSYYFSEDELGKYFYDEYLNKHKTIFDSIRKSFHNYYGRKHYLRKRSILYKTILNHIYSSKLDKNKFRSINDPRDLVLQNLRNSWYNELCFNADLVLDYGTSNSDKIGPMTSWKIIRFYYTIYTAISSCVRTFKDPLEFNQVGQDKMINVFIHEVVRKNDFKNNIPYPLHMYIQNYYNPNKELNPARSKLIYSKIFNQDFTGQKDDPNQNDLIHKLFQSFGYFNDYSFVHGNPNRKKKSEIWNWLNYFKGFRNWATYEDPFLFTRFYGEGISIDLSSTMRDLIDLYLIFTESVILKIYGSEVLFETYSNFEYEVSSKLEIDPKFLNIRLPLHLEYFED